MEGICSQSNDDFSMFYTRQIGIFDYSMITPVMSYNDGNEMKTMALFNSGYYEAVSDLSVYKEMEEPVDMHRTSNLRPADMHKTSNLSFGCKNPGIKFKGKYHIVLTKDDVSRVFGYLFRKATLEVEKFNKSEFLMRIAVKSDGILYSKTRILDTMRFRIEGGLSKDTLGLGEFGIKSKTPILDRFSPLSYSIGDYVHRRISRHGGYERCYRDSINHVFIIQGLSLFVKLGWTVLDVIVLEKGTLI